MAGVMRNPDGGGLTAAERGHREQMRLVAAEMIESPRQRPGGGMAVSGLGDVGKAVAAGTWPTTVKKPSNSYCGTGPREGYQIRPA